MQEWVDIYTCPWKKLFEILPLQNKHVIWIYSLYSTCTKRYILSSHGYTSFNFSYICRLIEFENSSSGRLDTDNHYQGSSSEAHLDSNRRLTKPSKVPNQPTTEQPWHGNWMCMKIFCLLEIVFHPLLRPINIRWLWLFRILTNNDPTL